MARKPEHYTAAEIWADLDRVHQPKALPASEGWRTAGELAEAWACSYTTAARRAEMMVADGKLESDIRTGIHHPSKVYRPIVGPKKGG